MTTISVEDVAALFGRDLTTAEESRCSRLIGYAEGAVEDALPGFSIATGSETAEFAVHDAVWTPRYPVSTINSLTIDGTEINPVLYRVTQKGHIEHRATGVSWPVYRWRCGDVTVDYDFGLDPAPFSIVSVVAAAVAGVLQRQSANADGVLSRSESVDGYSYTDQYDREAARVAAVTIDPSALRRWSRTRQVSVPLVTNG